MSGTELIMGMGEVITYLKDLETENKKLSRDYEFYKTAAKKSAEGIQKLRDEKYQKNLIVCKRNYNSYTERGDKKN